MKVLIATNSYPTSLNPSHQIFVKNICEGLKNKGIETDVVYNRYFDVYKSTLEAGGPVSSFIKSLMLLISFAPYMFYKARKYDIIYSHAAVWPGFFMLVAQKLYGVKHVCYVHGSVNVYSKRKGFIFRIARYTLKQCTLVVSNSRYMADRLLNDYECESTIVTPGYNRSLFFYKPADKKFDLVYAGHATKRKGVEIFLEAIKRHADFYQHQNLRVQIYCEGGKKKAYIDYTVKNNLPDIITFGNRVNAENLADIFRAAKIVVLPSREEPLGLVGLEAIACGAYVVTSDTGGMQEYVVESLNGTLFKTDDADALQNAIERAFRHYPHFLQTQPKAANSVEPFSLDHAIDETISLFHNLLDGQQN